ncbi:hypothetical protein [Nocardioides jejuensis]|uniref:Uncharacterized protein n=1 Tax=Nocardioides jejuensis TaxID=2502782 RepID=A0A4R1C009_9ACTN|nr:hypothetical protein [Nocardioides jejuensis]TCJ23046.1 hypothetical protein EPD65_11835 [Nocardioides jejuensis]
MSDYKYPTTDRGWRGLMEHNVPRKGRSRAPRPISVKPPKCNTCGYWLAPAFDHTACKKA